MTPRLADYYAAHCHYEEAVEELEWSDAAAYLRERTLAAEAIIDAGDADEIAAYYRFLSDDYRYAIEEQDRTRAACIAAMTRQETP
jgi:hypothetical protein